jgi:hypothetical protein
MIHTTNHETDLPAEKENEARTEMLHHLRRAYQVAPRLADVDAAVMQAIHSPSQPASGTQSRVERRLRLRLSLPIAALVALSLSIGMYIHTLAPAPVSAQTVLRHAETAGLVPNQVTHFVYHISSPAGANGTVQFWVRANANGKPESVAVNGAGDSIPDGAATPGLGLALALVFEYDVYNANSLPAAVTDNDAVSQQTLNGAPVDVLRSTSGQTLYFDAQSYILRGADWLPSLNGVSTRTAGSARLLQYGTVSDGGVPAGAWHKLTLRSSKIHR